MIDFNQTTNILYVFASILFIVGLKRLSKPKTAQSGNIVASMGMLIAVITALLENGLDYKIIFAGILIGSIIGTLFALKVEMTSMPQMVAIFNGLGGGASALIAIADFLVKTDQPTYYLPIVCFSIFVGTLTFSGSVVAFGKLQGIISGNQITFKGQQSLNLIIFISIIFISVYFSSMQNSLLLLVAFTLLLGITLVIPIGGADMPVVISLLNSYSGIAASATGFVLNNQGLIISGALVGASGIILTQIMCKGMNRSILNVIFAHIEPDSIASKNSKKQLNIKSYSTEDAAMIFDAAEKIIIVPGYGLAVAQAQYAVKEIADFLEKKNKKILYAIHPVAGRMPGHMNVLLAESNVSYEQLKDIDEINPEFEDCDVALVLGANDVVNPASRYDIDSPIYGMPILNVDKSRTVIVNKRSMNPGFAGITNELFGYSNTIMVFGDAKDMLTKLLADLKEL